MGRLEKIVVLTVVFLIAVILGVSLNEADVGDPVPDGSDPLVASGDADVARQLGARLDGLREVASGIPEPPREARQPILRSKPAVTEPQPASTPNGNGPRDERLAQRDRSIDANAVDELRSNQGSVPLLNSAVQLDGGSAPEGREAEEFESILVRTAGLRTTHDDQYMLYTWKSGDTFTSIARAYYDSMAHVRMLRLANEGRTERDLAAGDQILIPVFGPNDSSSSDRAYTVAEGDTLSSIAQKVYGDPSKYRKIFEANRDVLNDENTLALGQELRLPR